MSISFCKASRLLFGAGWLLCFSLAAADWPLKKVKVEIPPKVERPEFKSGVSIKNLLKLSRLTPAGLPLAKLSTAAAVETLRILALRVEFQKEVPDDPTTTGLGVFDRRTPDEFFAAEGDSVDPAPHDKKYFESHLQALDNFYQAVSNGKLKLAWDVWPQQNDSAYQLPHPKAYYGSKGPYKDSAVVFQISTFFKDAVHLADSLSSPIDFSAYQSLVIFHAGSDRQDDILGNSPNDFFTGFLRLGDYVAVDGGSYRVTEGLVLPESPRQDNRIVALNATLAHEFGHQLGLVDLYNTRTLLTQVGDFSLMDNNGSDLGVELSFGSRTVIASGLLPVYPDAWSRAFLGFVDTLVTTRGPLNDSVLAAELQRSATDMVKIPISEQEYFLVENRAVDFDGYPGSALRVDSVTGVVLGPARPQAGGSVLTGEYDALLPGSGILIWHVDEAVAFLDDDGDGYNNFESNTVNTNPQRRLLELKEADGFVDFGGNYFTGFGDAGDIYRAGNNSVFTPVSNPSSRNSFGGQTGISVTGIGPADTLMSLSVSSRYLLLGWPQFAGPSSAREPPVLGDLDADGQEEILARLGPFLLAWNQDGSKLMPTNLFRGVKTGLNRNRDTVSFPLAVFGLAGLSPSNTKGFFSAGPVGGNLNGDAKLEVVAGTDSGEVFVFEPADLNLDSLADILPGFPVNLRNGGITALLVGKADTLSVPVIFAGTSSGKGFLINSAGVVLDSNRFSGSIVGAALDSSGNLFVAARGNDSVFISRGFHPVWSKGVADSLISEPAVAEKDNGVWVAFATAGGKLYLYDGNGNLAPRFPIALGSNELPQPIWSNSSATGKPIILLAYDNKIVAYQTNGALVTDFPKSVDRQRPADGAVSVLANQLLLENRLDLLCLSPNGNLYFPKMNEREASFVLGTGAEVLTPPAVDANGRMFVRSTDGFMYGYSIGGFNFDALAWRQERHDFAGSNFLAKVSVPVPMGGALVAEKSFYNYPNPIVGGKTFLRYRLMAPSTATLTVYDMAGNRIYAPKAVPAEIGNDNEVELDCSGFASGVYLCRLEVASTGKKEVVFCKMAVVK